jgi:O-6-methylguanine DNA methyltransferase
MSGTGSSCKGDAVMNQTALKVFKYIATIPRGSVTTYVAVAKALGIHPRQVGRILHTNPYPSKYPCHRVVYSDGRLSKGYAFGGIKEQARKLESEGVRIKEYKALL